MEDYEYYVRVNEMQKEGRKEEARKAIQTTQSKATQHIQGSNNYSSKNELSQVGFEPTTLHTHVMHTHTKTSLTQHRP